MGAGLVACRSGGCSAVGCACDHVSVRLHFQCGGCLRFCVYSLLKAWAYLWSPSAQKNSGIVAAQVLSSAVAIEGCFALGYFILSSRVPDAFNSILTRIDSAYFAVSTATTTGLGDIHPVTQAARLLVTGQMVVSLFLVVIAVGTALTRLLNRPSQS